MSDLCGASFGSPQLLFVYCTCMTLYRMAGNFQGVLIFIIFMILLVGIKISIHEN